MKEILKSSVILFFVMTTVACENSTGIDSNEFDRTIQALAGVNAVNCGHVLIRESRTETNQCVVNEFNKKTPFYARYDLQGEDPNQQEHMF